MEVVISDGLSTDQTRQVIRAFQNQHPDLQLQIVDNQRRNIPSALNRALEAARGEFIVRLDAHSIPYEDYVERCIAALRSELGDNVGGMWDIRPRNNHWIAKSIAIAAAHPFGVGDARYRVGSPAQVVDTVPFGAFHRSLVERVGPFDERLLTNEDYEFNTRVRQSGGKVWFDPLICSIYFARPTFSSLARQYWRYGYWKARMLRNNFQTIRWRQLLPPLFAFSLIVLFFTGFFYLPSWYLLVMEVSIYLIFLLSVGFWEARRKVDIRFALGVPLAIAVMHLAWGLSFLVSIFFTYELQ